MALSPKARIAAVGGALAIGVLGAGGIAHATGGTGTGGGTATYVTVVDDEGAGTAPGRSAEDCPAGAGEAGGTGGTAPGDA